MYNYNQNIIAKIKICSNGTMFNYNNALPKETTDKQPWPQISKTHLTFFYLILIKKYHLFKSNVFFELKERMKGRQDVPIKENIVKNINLKWYKPRVYFFILNKKMTRRNNFVQ